MQHLTQKRSLPCFVPLFLAALLMFAAAAVSTANQPSLDQEKENRTAAARVETITEKYRAVGTIKPRMETRIESQIRATVKEVLVTSGDDVSQGQLLITLDSRQPEARLTKAEQALKEAKSSKRQAEQTIHSARAARKEASQQYQRIKGYYSSNAATEQELESAESAWLQAKANFARASQALNGAEARIQQAQEAVKEARVGLGFTEITAPFNGRVITRTIEPGDLALPGKPLMTIRTETGFRLEAHVREGMINRVKKGQELTAEITSLDRVCRATVEEIIPYADPETRTFLVKAAIPSLPGLYPGMYGKLLIPAASTEVVLVPADAVRKIGQLEIVMVMENSQYQKRYVKTGRTMDGMVEILSGLRGDETISYKRP
ncbi:MAG TPA: efflux RND transporter periplasmic adaptor subunit [Desulfobacteraceae bacterium]|nr:efflux RND transporter periplasmic adaptor subunit [Desulfobacteraceae bacterium]